MDSRDLMAHLHVYMEPGEEAFRGLEDQIRPIGNHITDIVWQTTVGIGDIPRALKTTISACSFSLRIRAAAVAPPATPPTMTTFMLSFHLSRISGNSAYVFTLV